MGQYKHYRPDPAATAAGLLREKNQTPEQQKQAAHALSLFFESQNAETKAATISTSSQNWATTEGLPLQVSEAATSPSTPFIKGEYLNLSKTGHGDLNTSAPRSSLTHYNIF